MDSSTPIPLLHLAMAALVGALCTQGSLDCFTARPGSFRSARLREAVPVHSKSLVKLILDKSSGLTLLSRLCGPEIFLGKPLWPRELSWEGLQTPRRNVDHVIDRLIEILIDRLIEIRRDYPLRGRRPRSRLVSDEEEEEEVVDHGRDDTVSEVEEVDHCRKHGVSAAKSFDKKTEASMSSRISSSMSNVALRNEWFEEDAKFDQAVRERVQNCSASSLENLNFIPSGLPPLETSGRALGLMCIENFGEMVPESKTFSHGCSTTRLATYGRLMTPRSPGGNIVGDSDDEGTEAADEDEIIFSSKNIDDVATKIQNSYSVPIRGDDVNRVHDDTYKPTGNEEKSCVNIAGKENVDSASVGIFENDHVFAKTSLPPRSTLHDSTNVEEEEVRKMVRECLELRDNYVYREAIAPWTKEPVTEPGTPKAKCDSFHFEPVEKSAHHFRMEDGVIHVYANTVELFPVASSTTFFTDMHHLLKVLSAGNVRSACHHRLRFLEEKFRLHLLVNADREFLAQKSAPHRDFYNIRKVVIFRDGKYTTLKEVFESLELSGYDLNVDLLDVHADKSTFHRFDKFNLKYNPCGQSRLREIFLKQDNLIQGRFLAEVTKQVLSDLETSKYQMSEYRVSIYGRKQSEWDQLASWFINNEIYGDTTVWLIQSITKGIIGFSEKCLESLRSPLEQKVLVFSPSSGSEWVVVVDNLSRRVSRRVIWELFKRHGDVVKVFIPLVNRRPKYKDSNFAFVHFGCKKDVANAIAKVNNTMIDQKRVSDGVAKFAKRKDSGANRGMAAEMSGNNLNVQNKNADSKREFFNKFNDGRSYKEALANQKVKAGEEKLVNVFIPAKEKEWMKLVLTGIMKADLELDVECLMEAWLNKKDELSYWFDWIDRLVMEIGVPMTYCFVELSGVPLNCRHEAFFTTLASRWGLLVGIHDETLGRKDLSVAKLILRIVGPFDVPSLVTVLADGRSYKIGVKIGSTLVKPEVDLDLVSSEDLLGRGGVTGGPRRRLTGMVNVDGAVISDWRKGGIGGLLRDSNRRSLLFFSESVGPGHPILAELKAIRAGLKLFVEWDWGSTGRLIMEVVGFDLVDDENKPERRRTKHMPTPAEWTNEFNPAYSYYAYYFYANLYTLNKLRESKGMQTIKLRPHCGEAGDIDHLAAAFLLCNNISHGINLRKSPVLQYLYYLAQAEGICRSCSHMSECAESASPVLIGLAMSPLSNNSLFLDYHRNPFPSFFQRGLNVSLSSDDPLQIHLTKEALVEEYSVAAQLHWLGNKYFLRGPEGNDIQKTNVPNMRIAFRHKTWIDEMQYLYSGRARVPEEIDPAL
ncbi:putative AMP deaminase [Hibiscus syriacus]|uniref:AMP deaminase n=1 Tax=Hibiscus syriacus TaxID=106335 RepID=A0A6A2WSR7_HIBSY|nr:putative AMP deaminase [Hibiscus syriacus]